MVSLESNNPIYDNAIEMYFHEYFEKRNIELDGHAYKAVPNNLFQGAFMYVHEKLFKPLEFQGLRKNSTIDYNNGALLEYIVSIYGKLVMQYDIKATQNMFCALTGIHRDTLHSWETSNTRTVIYKDLQGNIINNINEYILNNRGEYVTEPSQTHSDLVKKIKSFSHDSAYNGLNDTPVGQITHANNSREAGMEYNRKREIESAVTQQMSLEDIRREVLSLGNIAQENDGLLEVVD